MSNVGKLTTTYGIDFCGCTSRYKTERFQSNLKNFCLYTCDFFKIRKKSHYMTPIFYCIFEIFIAEKPLRVSHFNRAIVRRLIIGYLGAIVVILYSIFFNCRFAKHMLFCVLNVPPVAVWILSRNPLDLNVAFRNFCVL